MNLDPAMDPSASVGGASMTASNAASLSSLAQQAQSIAGTVQNGAGFQGGFQGAWKKD